MEDKRDVKREKRSYYELTCSGLHILLRIRVMPLVMLLLESHFLSYLEHFSEKVMAPHSSTLAWKIPWAEEPGGLPSVGSHRVGHD